MSEKAKIFETIIEVMDKISAISKERKNQQQGFLYRSIDDVMNELHPIFAHCGLFVVPKVLREERQERQSGKGGTLLYSRQTIKFTFYARDGSNISAVVIGEGMDSGDKASNKALSIGFKYAVLQVFCIPTKEDKDPDGVSYGVSRLKGGESSEQEKTEIKKLLKSTDADGRALFTNEEQITYLKMRESKTAQELIAILKEEIKKCHERQIPEDIYS